MLIEFLSDANISRGLQFSVFSKRMLGLSSFLGCRCDSMCSHRDCAFLKLWLCAISGLFGFGGFENRVGGLEDWDVAFGRGQGGNFAVEV